MSFIYDRIRVDTKVAIEKGESASRTNDKHTIKSAIAILKDTKGKLVTYQDQHNILGKLISFFCGDKKKLNTIDDLLGKLEKAVSKVAAGVIPPAVAGAAPEEAPPAPFVPPPVVGGPPPPPPPPPPGAAVPGAWRNKAPAAGGVEAEPHKASPSKPARPAGPQMPAFDPAKELERMKQRNKPPEGK